MNSGTHLLVLFCLSSLPQIDADDIRKIEQAIADTQKWIDSNENAETHEYEARKKEVETVCMPVMKKMYEAGGEGAMPGMGDSMPEGQPSTGPKVEDLD